MKNQTGVSVLEVVISIIILIMIAFFAIYSSQNSIAKAEATELYSEMKSVQTAVEAIRLEAITNSDFSLKINQHYDRKIENGNDEEPTYIIYGNLDTTHDSGKAAEYIGIENLKRDYIVSYETGKVSLFQAADINGTKVTEIEQLESFLGISN